MGKNYKEYLEGFDMELLESALRRGEKFNGVEERVDMNCTGKSAPIVEKTEICKITEKFIEANFNRLLELRIIKEK